MRNTASSISGVTWEGFGSAQKPVGVAWKVADVVKNGFRVDWKPFLVTQKTGFVSLKVGEMECKWASPGSGCQHKVSHPSRDARLGTPPLGWSEAEPQERVVEGIQARAGGSTLRNRER
jgi:hypothetical protein